MSISSSHAKPASFHSLIQCANNSQMCIPSSPNRNLICSTLMATELIIANGWNLPSSYWLLGPSPPAVFSGLWLSPRFSLWFTNLNQCCSSCDLWSDAFPSLHDKHVGRLCQVFPSQICVQGDWESATESTTTDPPCSVLKWLLSRKMSCLPTPYVSSRYACKMDRARKIARKEPGQVKTIPKEKPNNIKVWEDFNSESEKCIRQKCSD